MLWVVIFAGKLAGVYTSPVDAALRSKALGGRVIQCVANSDIGLA